MRILHLSAALLLGAMSLGAQAPKAEPKPAAPKVETKPVEKPMAAKTEAAEAEAKPAAKPARMLNLVGCKEGKTFHKHRCKVLKEAGDKCVKVAFTWRQEALQSGFKPCETCKP